MLEILEVLNGLSPARTGFYIVAGIICLLIIVSAIVDIIDIIFDR